MAKKNSKSKILYGFEDAGSEFVSVEALGGKGFYLLDMHRKGLPVPAARVISTELCRMFKADPDGVRTYLKNEAIPEIVKSLKQDDGTLPLFSVRSGAKVSMPGMMDTVLNVGLTKSALPMWEQRIGARAARDCRRRLLQMFGNVVFGIDGALFEKELEAIKSKRRVTEDKDLSETDLTEVIAAFEKVLKKEKVAMPETLEEQLLVSAEAVLKSWDNERAQTYRKIRGYSDDWGTAIVVQRMVFGNVDDLSCSGVLFTRNPALGTQDPMGDFLVNAQGEDVVAGVRTPDPIYKMKAWNPVAYEKLMSIAEKLEREARDVQDIEFTVESGEVYFLQTRTAQRSALAAVKIAVDMAKSGLITKEEALERVSLAQYEQLCSPMIAPTFNGKPDTTGLAASNGIATGEVVFSSDEAVEHAGNCILIAEETTPEDLPGMHAACGILTGTGGVTSHAAVVARGMDKVCIVGASEIKFVKNKDGEIVEAKFGGASVRAGDTITMDGATGRVWVGTSVPVVPGGSLPAMLDFNDMIYEVFPVYRIVTDGRDLHEDFHMVYATYALDGMSDSQIRREIQDSVPYLRGVIDLSTLEEHAPPEDAEILALGGSTRDDEVFEIKAEALLSSLGDKSRYSVYLGRRTDGFKTRFERSGFSVIVPAKVNEWKKSSSIFTICTGDETDMSSVWDAARKGQAKSVAAVGSAPSELLKELSQQKASGIDVVPVIAMSVPQILSSIKR